MAELLERVLCENSRPFDASAGKQWDREGGFLESGFVSSGETKRISTSKGIRMDSFHAMYGEMADRAKDPRPRNLP